MSLRSSDGAVDVSAIAREHGGGGHMRAAGFGTDLAYPEIVEFLRERSPSSLTEPSASSWSTSRRA